MPNQALDFALAGKPRLSLILCDTTAFGFVPTFSVSKRLMNSPSSTTDIMKFTSLASSRSSRDYLSWMSRARIGSFTDPISLDTLLVASYITISLVFRT